MQLLDAKEVARILQISTPRVYELTRQGILPSVRIGARQIRFEEERLLQWIENGGGLSATNEHDHNLESDAVTANIKQRFPGARSSGEGGSLRKRKHNELPFCLDDLRKFEPIHFVLECTLRPG
jgi:excisionase family DNA binding protein